MAVIRLEQFNGIIPKTHPTLLPDGCAVKAHNCKLKNGKLVPLREPKIVSGALINYENNLNEISDAKTIYLWHKKDGSTEFIAYPTDDVDIVEGNIADDDKSRLFVTGSTGVGANGTDPIVLLKDISSNSVIRHTLVKDRLAKPLCVLSRGGNADTNNTRYTYFFQTWVDQYGYESGVSDAGELWYFKYIKETTVTDGQSSILWKDGYRTIVDGENIPSDAELGDLTIIITNKEETDPPNYKETVYYAEETGYNNGDNIIFYPCDTAPDGAVSRRIYKVVTGTETDNIQFVAEIPVYAQVGVGLKDEDAGEVIPSIESPTDTMRGIKAVPNGYFVAFRTDKPKTVMFSDVSIPNSWPEEYQYEVRDNVVALAVSGNTVFVLTDGMPYSFTGTAPEAMTSSVLQGPAACLSVKSVCVHNGAVYYASNAGIATIKSDYYSGVVTHNLTEKIFTKDQWQELNPASCVMGVHDGAIHAFFSKKNGENVGYTINLNDGAAAITTHDENTSCLCVDKVTDKMFYVRRIA